MRRLALPLALAALLVMPASAPAATQEIGSDHVGASMQVACQRRGTGQR